MSSVENLVQKINALPKEEQTLLIAIDGLGGSGKTTLAAQLRDSLDNVTLVTLDDFYSPTLGRADRLRVIEQVIKPLKNNDVARYQRFDWGIKRLAEWRDIKPGGIVIVEGVSTLHREFDGCFNFKIWIECPPEEGFRRGLARDLSNGGVDTTNEWVNVWMPQEKEYIETEKPQERADIVLDYKELV